MQGFEALGIARLMLTGDRRRAAEAIAREAGIRDFEAELLPEQKLDRVRALAGNTAMVGDGINDAPALASASVGIAVSGASDIAAEAAQVVFLPRSLEKLPVLFTVSRRAVATAWQNIILFAGVVNAVAVICAATGVIGPIGAALTHQLSSFLVMLNSLRLLRVERTAPKWVGRSMDRLRHLTGRLDFPAAWRWIFERRGALARPALYVALALVLLNGLYVVRPDQVGVIQRFGRKVLPLSEPGLHYKLPWPVERLTRVQSRRVRTVEIGFRTNSSSPDAEPAAYEWNVQHREGRFQRKPEEALMLTGDQNMIELNATVHYDLTRPDEFLFGQLDGETTIRATAESCLESVVAAAPLDEVLTTGRQAIEGKARAELQRRLDRYATGIRVLGLRLEDVHPSLEVVDAFRSVSGAYEEKNRLVNEAEGYRNEQVALARGNARARLQNANSYTVGRTNRAMGDASRFAQREVAFRGAPGTSETRLYLEAMEQILPGRRKFILDKTKAPRRFFLMEDSVEIGGPAMSPMLAPPAARRPPEEQ